MLVSHDDGPRHLKLFDSYLLGIGAHSSIRYPHCIRLRPPNLKFSDRYGRVQFLGLNFTALLLADAVLAALAVAPDYVPGGYWLVVYVSAFEGLIGGKVWSCGSDDAE
jgi:MFS family permease